MNNVLILEEKNYDLNLLLSFNFDTLKEVLTKLSTKIINLESEVTQLKNLDKEKNNKITHLENQIDNFKEIISNINKNEESIKHLTDDDLLNFETNNNNNKENDPTNNITRKNTHNNTCKNFDNNTKKEEMQNTQINSMSKKPKTPEIKIDNIKIDFHKTNNKENFENLDKQVNKNELRKIISSGKSDNNENNNESNNENNNQSSEYKIIDNKINLDSESISSEKITNLIQENPEILNYYKNKKPNNISEHTIYSILQQIKLLNSKFKNLEKEFLPIIKKDISSLKSSKIPTILKKISSIEENTKNKFSQIEEDIERCNEQAKKFDYTNLFAENNDGVNSEVSKIYYKLLEDKMNKNDKKYEDKFKNLSADNSQLFTNILNNKNNIEKLNIELTSLQNQTKDVNNQLSENQKLSINDLLTQNNKTFFDMINSEIQNQISLNNTKIEAKTNEFLDSLREEIKSLNNSIPKNNNNNEDFVIDKTLLDFAKKKINELDNEVSVINCDINGIKQYAKEKNKNFEDINQNFNTISKNLTKKIEIKDLNELYQMNSDNISEIHCLKDKIKDINEILEKFLEDKSKINRKIEILSQKTENKKRNSINKSNNPQINLSNYIKDKQLKDALIPINQDIEKLMNEKELINLRIEDINDKIKNFENKDSINKLEENLTNQFSEISINFKNKYIDKIEFNKIIKNIDIQLKLLSEKSQTKENDNNWILAKKSINCFNCASCEANVINNPQKEFISWNKFSGDRQYRLGQGFSKLLQKINENKIYIDPKEQSFDNELKNNYLTNSVNNLLTFGLKKENNENLSNKKKYTLLPKLYKAKRKKKSWDNNSIPVSEDDKEGEEDSLDFGLNSPKIIKITRLKNDGYNDLRKITKNFTPHARSIGLNTDLRKPSIFSERKSGKLNRVKSLPLYD